MGFFASVLNKEGKETSSGRIQNCHEGETSVDKVGEYGGAAKCGGMGEEVQK